MLPVIAWLRAGCLPGFFTCKATVFPFVINQVSGRKTLEDNVNIQFSLKLSLTNFGNHLSFLPESNISMMWLQNGNFLTVSSLLNQLHQGNSPFGATVPLNTLSSTCYAFCCLKINK